MGLLLADFGLRCRDQRSQSSRRAASAQRASDGLPQKVSRRMAATCAELGQDRCQDLPSCFVFIAASLANSNLASWQVEYKKRKSFYEKTDWAAIEGLFALRLSLAEAVGNLEKKMPTLNLTWAAMFLPKLIR